MPFGWRLARAGGDLGSLGGRAREVSVGAFFVAASLLSGCTGLRSQRPPSTPFGVAVATRTFLAIDGTCSLMAPTTWKESVPPADQGSEVVLWLAGPGGELVIVRGYPEKRSLDDMVARRRAVVESGAVKGSVRVSEARRFHDSQSFLPASVARYESRGTRNAAQRYMLAFTAVAPDMAFEVLGVPGLGRELDSRLEEVVFSLRILQPREEAR